MRHEDRSAPTLNGRCEFLTSHVSTPHPCPLERSVFLTYHWGAQCGVDEWDKINGACPPDYTTHPIDFSADYHVFSVEFNTR